MCAGVHARCREDYPRPKQRAHCVCVCVCVMSQVPVSSTPVEGTQWSEVKCEDGRVYYYNAETDVSDTHTHTHCL